MNKFRVRDMKLEVTRFCNLECVHCMRGDREDKYMSLDIIDKIFSSVCKIDRLLLTGGEPFLAVEQLKRIVHNIEKNNIRIDNIGIITNGSILSDEILNILKYFDMIANLKVIISQDKFHLIELESKGLLNNCTCNINSLKANLKHVSSERSTNMVIYRLGKAALLTQEELENINNSGSLYTHYEFANDEDMKRFREHYNIPFMTEFGVYGSLYIDVDGNITDAFIPYKDEDKNSYVNIKNDKELLYSINEASDRRYYGKG